MDDLTLLRKYEPVMCFTQGEMYFPCAVDEYVKLCSLWLRDNKGRETPLVPAGQLTLETLAKYNHIAAKHTLYLRLVDTPLDPVEYQRWRVNRPAFKAPGRLARVGLFSRMLDSLFNLSLILRGTVPGGTTAAAQQKYTQMQQADPRDVYYCRVIREGGYIILHYLFFLVMNDWRSSFYGVNDHEADWEQVFVYLSDEGEAEPTPRWVAYASHDFSGDDLRRRWDDPNLYFFQHTHPLVFAGAGSHASYFEPGEYKMSFEPEFLLPVKNAGISLKKLWAEKLGQGLTSQNDDTETVGALLSVPFVDYARGDGVRIGPGQKRGWSPILVTREMGWIEQYRGLWGLDTKDPLGGERAPAGPKYNRDGSVRMAWYDPLGWAGLDKVPPPSEAPARLRERIDMLTAEIKTVETKLEAQRESLRLLNLEVHALRETDYLHYIFKTQQEKLETEQEALHQLYNQHTELIESRQATQSYLDKIERGDWGDPQGHIKHRHLPEPPIGKQARITELWAALSSGLLLFVFTLLLSLAPTRWFFWTLGVGLIFLALEATMRGRLAGFLLNLTIFLAVLLGLILIKDFWWIVLILGMFALMMVTIISNLRELWDKG